ncbi:hypothetical protein BDW42DRAFT_194619 [Aspergillus taichungensis]|uniref:Uncharacterized protein n=1 Tax=Aspergillus taichungensis TaxID=482145 RepID=A0A2J5HSB0_9EURO|nr:hypothetical protein BDW42DRAFT_194619 [Aspergillus taichungensis]
MRFTSAFVAIALTLATGSIASAINIESRQFCTQQCLPEKPSCPKGEMAGGSEGCWSACCVTIGPKVPFKKPITPPEDQTGDNSEEKDETEKTCNGKSDGEQDENKGGPVGNEPVTI